MPMEVKITGIEKVSKNLDALDDQIIHAIQRALFQEGEALMAEAKPITPFEFGTLRNSGYVTLPEIKNDTVEVTVGFGGAAQAYALPVHEKTWVYHKPPTQAKYLEEPFNRRAKGFDQRIGQVVAPTLK